MDGIGETKIGEKVGEGSTRGDQPVTISAPPAATVTVDPQNPLPETSFFWRRIITMVMAFGLLGLAWHNAIQLHDLRVSRDLLTLAQWCIGLNAFVLLCYFVGPSAAELTNMIQSAKIIRSSLDMATSADNNQSNAAMNADDNATRAGFQAAERDSALRMGGDSRFPEIAPDAAPTARQETDDIDHAPRGRT